MDNFKIKLKFLNFQLVMEGNENAIEHRIKDFQENGLGKLGAQIERAEAYLSLQKNEVIDANPSNSETGDATLIKLDIPTYEELEIKNKVKTEGEWILYFAFTVCDDNNKFTLDNLRAAYKNKRGTSNKMKKFSLNYKGLIKSNFLKPQTSDVIIISEEGENKIKEIFNSENKSVSPSKNRTTKNVKTKKTKIPERIMLEEFDVNSTNDLPSLEQFFNKKGSPTSTDDRIITIGYYITEFKQFTEFTEGQLCHALKILGLTWPATLHQIHTNLSNYPKQWIEKGSAKDKWKLTTYGIQEVDQNLPRIEKDT